MRRKIVIIFSILALGGASYLTLTAWRHGFSAREKPSWLESYLARHARKIATPARAKELKNPYHITPESLAAAREHWVNHCSSCHGLDGLGNTTIGRNLYPKAPDMRDAQTQGLTDGELFYIISNGVRFTGMPAWGSEDSPQSIWELVAFIRRMPQLSPEELKLMQELASGAREEGKTGGSKPTDAHAPGTAPHKH